jgi:hypothetical protein
MNPDVSPIINEIGIREFMARIMGYVNKATKLSYFEDKEIYMNMFYFDMSLTELVAKRADLWELDIETAKALKDAAIELVQSILFSARSGFTAINLRSQYSRSDSTRTDASNSQQSPRTFFGIPIGRAK